MFLIVVKPQGEERREGLAEGGVGGVCVGGDGGGGEALGAEFRAFSPSSLPHLNPPPPSHSSPLPPRSFVRRQRSAPKRLPGGLLWQQVASETAGMSCARED